MITKEQAMTCEQFRQIADLDGSYSHNGFQRVFIPLKGSFIPLDKPIMWRANGKCKTWKTRPTEFKLPIKHGMYSYGYITQDNAHLFEVDA